MQESKQKVQKIIPTKFIYSWMHQVICKVSYSDKGTEFEHTTP